MYISVFFFEVEKKQGAKKRKKECALPMPWNELNIQSYYINICLKSI